LIRIPSGMYSLRFGKYGIKDIKPEFADDV